jgi:hypothetical protein
MAELVAAAYADRRATLLANPQEIVPSFGVVYDDAYGYSELHIQDMQLTQLSATGNPQPTFDLAYTHTDTAGAPPPAPLSLKRLMPPRSTLTESDERFNIQFMFDAAQGVRLKVDFNALESRTGLLELGHEIGHSKQEGMTAALLKYAVSGRLGSTAMESQFVQFAPAVEALATAEATDPEHAHNMAVVRYIDTELDNRSVAVAKLCSSDSLSGVRAIQEADAWVRTLRTVRDNLLHPGMSESDIKDYAFGCIDTYDHGRSDTLFRDTLQHALAFEQ